MTDQLHREVRSFEGLWEGGYYEGDPLDPLGASSYGPLGYMSVLYATYLVCIKPYVTAETVALEIGCGRGAWTKPLLPAREVWCLDVLSAEYNGFWKHVGHHDHVRYVQVLDFSLTQLPEDHFDYVFSFGALTHVSFAGTEAYMRNLWPKLRPGAHAFVMVADYDKYRRTLANVDSLSVARGLGGGWRGRVLRAAWRLTGGTRAPTAPPIDEDEIARPGRWYNAGVSRTCVLLETLGYEVVDPDVGSTHRDPIIHFRKP